MKCQISNKDILIAKLNDSSYASFLKCINERALYGEHEFMLISDRVNNFTVCQLREHNAVWHRNCYADPPSKRKIQRIKDGHENLYLCAPCFS